MFYFSFLLVIIDKNLYDLGEELYQECFAFLLNNNSIIDEFMSEKLKNQKIEDELKCCETQEFMLEIFIEGRTSEILHEDQKMRISIQNSK